MRLAQQGIAHGRRIARGLTAGGLLVAGVLTFPGGRQLGDWLLG